jgi:hypothetical protein
MYFNLFHAFMFFSTNTHTYVRTYVYYGNDFDLRKIRMTQYIPEWSDCVSRGASVIQLLFYLPTTPLGN